MMDTFGSATIVREAEPRDLEDVAVMIQVSFDNTFFLNIFFIFFIVKELAIFEKLHGEPDIPHEGLKLLVFKLQWCTKWLIFIYVCRSFQSMRIRSNK